MRIVFKQVLTVFLLAAILSGSGCKDNDDEYKIAYQILVLRMVLASGPFFYKKKFPPVKVLTILF